jgi:hypothetical protein
MEEDEPSCGSKGTEEFPKAPSVKNGNCVNFHKCGATKSFTVSRSRRVCSKCYGDTIDHTFKKGMQLVKPTKRSGVTPLLVAVSGGPSSTALLALFRQLLDQDARKVHFSVHVVWVDCLDVLPVSPEEAQEIREQIKALATGFKSFKRLPLCGAFSRGSLEPEESGVCQEKLKKVFEGTRPMVAWKEDLLAVLIRSLLLRYAQYIGVNRIVTGENMTRVSVRFFSNMSRGIGVNAASVGEICLFFFFFFLFFFLLMGFFNFSG